ncbi:hypothetical protein AXG93_2584s1410 [Marchantia polymorpha subsp. ruderalis]|uniref:Uncharacterized protein n=1 Tax=Marchantia polymorpha subsp. ruderalis TaxID=1480154 RepID=A0A176VHK8_MARPO|nr:hypothetical protein AXG93_2584s1410 [Marchantia polymorpha subsp. ruderalis]
MNPLLRIQGFNRKRISSSTEKSFRKICAQAYNHLRGRGVSAPRTDRRMKRMSLSSSAVVAFSALDPPEGSVTLALLLSAEEGAVAACTSSTGLFTSAAEAERGSLLLTIALVKGSGFVCISIVRPAGNSSTHRWFSLLNMRKKPADDKAPALSTQLVDVADYLQTAGPVLAISSSAERHPELRALHRWFGGCGEKK